MSPGAYILLGFLALLWFGLVWYVAGAFIELLWGHDESA